VQQWKILKLKQFA